MNRKRKIVHGQGASNMNYSNFTNRVCDKTIIVATSGGGGGGGGGRGIWDWNYKNWEFRIKVFSTFAPVLLLGFFFLQKSHFVYIWGQEVLISIFYQPYIQRTCEYLERQLSVVFLKRLTSNDRSGQYFCRGSYSNSLAIALSHYSKANSLR